MEILLILVVLAGGGWWLCKRFYRVIRSAHRQNLWQRQNDAVSVGRQQQQQRQMYERRRRQQALNQKYRALQVALLQLDQAPDFQRAASRAEAASEVPLALRQRQYRRFRQKLVRHFVRRLRMGTETQVLLDSLTVLVEALGVAGFEASYIEQAASRQLQNRTMRPAENFSATLERVQREHADRKAALNQASLDPDTKQQLQEAQDQQLVESLMEMTLGNRGEET
ncbi:hypothetical protein Pan241w_04030 [Gimesia alba]|uniref:Uncharacterized protein n=1 Tax=Gimesia alba TaxID=2527973 RepID=A0A517R8W4_9PLAN|nr:hypothetical protein [Gimesia alba]QDT40347.1 hypothetical protein Pan241w_04030 [Gimesia alba]